MRITRADIGKTVRFMGCNRAAGIEQTGEVKEISNGIAVLSVPYFLVLGMFDRHRAEYTPNREPWRMLLPVADKRIVGIGG